MQEAAATQTHMENTNLSAFKRALKQKDDISNSDQSGKLNKNDMWNVFSS